MSSNHTKYIPKYPENLPGTFWGITCFFNPAGYKKKIEIYKQFRQSSKKQGLRLLCVELAFGNTDFELNQDAADILVRRRTQCVLWQKERLLNIGLQYLPDDCDKIAWIDADLLFCNENWIEQSCNLLESYIVIQPFSHIYYLPKYPKSIDHNKASIGYQENQKFHGIAYGTANYGLDILQRSFRQHGHTGHVWAGRRKVFDKHGFYDRRILGSGDVVNALGFYGCSQISRAPCSSEAMMIDQEKWGKEVFADVRGSVSYVDGLIYHLWHGRRTNKFYGFREKFLRRYNFDPNKDIKLDKNDCWIWATNISKLHKFTNNYFILRNDDGLFHYNLICFFYFLWLYIINHLNIRKRIHTAYLIKNALFKCFNNQSNKTKS